MKKIALVVICIIFASCFGKENSQEMANEPTWRFTNQKDSFGENTGENILFGTFNSENKELMIVLTAYQGGRSCILSVKDGTRTQSLDGVVIKARNSTETIMLEMRNGFVTHASNNLNDPAVKTSRNLIASLNSVDRLGNYSDFITILASDETLKLSIEGNSFSAIFQIEPDDFVEKFDELKRLNNQM